jgi:hypothetical protein
MRRAALLWLVVVLAWGRPVLAEPEPNGLRLLCDGGKRWGAGALVQDFRPGHEGGFLLLTALHVVAGCVSIEPKTVTCKSDETAILSSPWSKTHPVEGLAWKDFDLAALVIPAEERARFTSPPLRLVARADLKVPERDNDMKIVAKADLNVCPLIPARRRDLVTVKDLFVSHGQPDRYEMLGSLTNETVILSYESTATRGTSGAPVVSQPGQILAVHVGGGDKLQWGVPIATDDLLKGKVDSIALNAGHPHIDVADYGPPKMLVETDARTAAEIDVRLHSDDLLAMLETSTPVDPFGAVAISPQIGWSHQWFSLPFALLDTAIGSRVLVGGQFGQYRSPVYSGEPMAPTHIEAPRDGTARLPFYGGIVEVDAELHMARLAPLQYVASLGMRAGVSHQKEVNEGANSFVWGPVVSGRAKWRLLPRASAAFQIHLAVQHIPVAATPIDCIGPSVARDSVWDVWGGVGVGMELEP